MRLLVLFLVGCATAGGGGTFDAAPPPPVDAPLRPDARPVPDAALFDAPLAVDASVPDAPRPDAAVVFDAAPPDAAPPDAGPTFPVDDDTVGAFEMIADVDDSSGNGNDGIYLGGTFLGGALEFVDPNDATGFDWSAHAGLLVHPFTIEMVLHTSDTTPYQKVFGFDDASDNGWYVYMGMFVAYIDGATMVGAISAGDVHYLAFVSISAISMDVYIDGTRQGVSIPLTFTAPPASALFFRDDTVSGRSESLRGGVDAMRISSKQRSAAEITAEWQRVMSQP